MGFSHRCSGRAGTPTLHFRGIFPTSRFEPARPTDLPLSVATRDLIHKFYPQQEQINGGRNDRFAAVSDAGGLVMGYYDGSKLPLWKWAQEYIVSPYAGRGYVDHAQYDTTSIIEFITHRFALEPLPGVRPQMGDLTAAFDFSR